MPLPIDRPCSAVLSRKNTQRYRPRYVDCSRPWESLFYLVPVRSHLDPKVKELSRFVRVNGGGMHPCWRAAAPQLPRTKAIHISLSYPTRPPSRVRLSRVSERGHGLSDHRRYMYLPRILIHGIPPEVFLPFPAGWEAVEGSSLFHLCPPGASS